MKITFEFSPIQITAFKQLLESSMTALEAQRQSLTTILTDQAMQEAQKANVMDYLHKVIVPQQLIASGILDAINAAEHPIIMP